MRFWLVLLVLMSGLFAKAQTLVGQVYDQLNHHALVGATVSILSLNQGASTDEHGKYSVDDLMPGSVNVLVSHVGYRTVEVPNVWLKAGKVTVQDFYLERSSDNLDKVVVSAPRPNYEPGKLTITEEQINRFAATYYDPARLLTNSPDVAVANDQNNQVSVRGLSPNYNVWKLEGAEIVNPNHLSNAGTFLDQPSATGGGVNMLSAQMLDRSAFLYSTFSSEHGNSVGGIFDMHLKKGTKEERQYTAQASLIGFDLMAEGPFKKGGKMTYAANYRYSFTGLLTGFGVDFGGESIGFQDLSFNVSSPVGKHSQLKLFGIGGMSYNDFTHKPFEESEIEKDRSDINYQNATAIGGISLTSGYEKSNIKTAVVYSITDDSRAQTNYDNNDVKVDSQEINNRRALLSINSQLHFRPVSFLHVDLGFMANTYYLDYYSRGKKDQFAFRPYLKFSGFLSSSFSWEIGASYLNSAEFRSKFTWYASGLHTFTLAGGQYAQYLNNNNYFFNEPVVPFSYRDTFQESIRFTLGHQYHHEGFFINSEFFYYRFPEVNTLRAASDEVSGLRIKPEVIQAREQAYTGGFSTMVSKNMTNGFYLHSGLTIYQSMIGKYDNPYNTSQSATLSLGKTWNRKKGDLNKSFSLDFRGMYQGAREINTDQYNNYVYVFGQMFPTSPENERLGYYSISPYLRFDLRMVWKRHHQNRTSSLALDLQNVANIRNESYQYYDDFTHQFETQYQLGLIPILAYRVEW